MEHVNVIKMNDPDDMVNHKLISISRIISAIAVQAYGHCQYPNSIKILNMDVCLSPCL